MQNLSYDTLVTIEEAIQFKIDDMNRIIEWGRKRDPENPKLREAIERRDKFVDAMEALEAYDSYVANFIQP